MKPQAEGSERKRNKKTPMQMDCLILIELERGMS